MYEEHIFILAFKIEDTGLWLSSCLTAVSDMVGFVCVFITILKCLFGVRCWLDWLEESEIRRHKLSSQKT